VTRAASDYAEECETRAQRSTSHLRAAADHCKLMTRTGCNVAGIPPGVNWGIAGFWRR